MTIILKPQFEETLSGTEGRIAGDAVRAEVQPLAAPLHQLRIYERSSGNKSFHQYELFSPELKIFNNYKSPKNSKSIGRRTSMTCTIV